MKNNKLKFIVLVFISVFIFGLPTQILAQKSDDQLRLEGFELAKGVDITDTYRVGTIFAGEVFNANDIKIGRWTAMLSHRGTENIEVCGGRGDIVTMRLTIKFDSGEKLVLGMIDLSGEDDVFWDNIYNGPPCALGGLVCESSPFILEMPLWAIPSIVVSFPPFFETSAISSMVCSPSPMTTMSKSLRNFSG